MKIICTPAVTEWRYKVTCNNCDTVLEAEASDLRKVNDQRDGNFAQCICAVCKAPITIAHSQIPKGVWARLGHRKSPGEHWHD